MTSEYRLLPKIINGGIGGITGFVCVFPLDLVKTRLQKQVVGPDGKKMYNNLEMSYSPMQPKWQALLLHPAVHLAPSSWEDEWLDAFVKIYKAEGFLGMYRGLLISTILITPEKALKLSANDYFRQKFRDPDGTIPMHLQIAAGGLAGFSHSIVTAPMELFKIQMQDAGRVAAEAKKAGRTVEKVTLGIIFKNIIRTNGILGLYKGVGASMMRDVTFAMIYFPLMAVINHQGPRRADGQAVFWWTLVAGNIAGGVGALLVTPVDVVKTRIQTVSKEAGAKTARVLPTLMDILRNEGPTALFKGGTCRIIVIAPLFGITQTVFYLGVAERLLGYK